MRHVQEEALAMSAPVHVPASPPSAHDSLAGESLFSRGSTFATFAVGAWCCLRQRRPLWRSPGVDNLVRLLPQLLLLVQAGKKWMGGLLSKQARPVKSAPSWIARSGRCRLCAHGSVNVQASDNVGPQRQHLQGFQRR
jgi:hypothetical protein